MVSHTSSHLFQTKLHRALLRLLAFAGGEALDNFLHFVDVLLAGGRMHVLIHVKLGL